MLHGFSILILSWRHHIYIWEVVIRVLLSTSTFVLRSRTFPSSLSFFCPSTQATQQKKATYHHFLCFLFLLPSSSFSFSFPPPKFFFFPRPQDYFFYAPTPTLHRLLPLFLQAQGGGGGGGGGRKKEEKKEEEEEEEEEKEVGCQDFPPPSPPSLSLLAPV